MKTLLRLLLAASLLLGVPTLPAADLPFWNGAYTTTDANGTYGSNATPIRWKAIDNGDGTFSLSTSSTSASSGSSTSTTIATAQTAASTTAAQLVASDSTRKSLLITNSDSAITIYVGPAGVTSSTGYPLKPGATLATSTQAAIYVLSASGTPSVATWKEN